MVGCEAYDWCDGGTTAGNNLDKPMSGLIKLYISWLKIPIFYDGYPFGHRQKNSDKLPSSNKINRLTPNLKNGEKSS